MKTFLFLYSLCKIFFYLWLESSVFTQILLKNATLSADSSAFDVTVLVDEVMTQGNSEVNLVGTVYGSSGQSQSIPLGTWRPGREKKYQTKANLAGIGDLTKLRYDIDLKLRLSCDKYY